MPERNDLAAENYFIGSNTSSGFVNYSDDIFSGLSKIYVIKGGPGTGKSTFMKQVAARAEKSGYEALRYYCSSDNASLDAVTVPRLGIALTDGTSPHVYEAKYPGAKEVYLDFGKFWNTDFLSQCFDKIKSLSDRKSSLYASVYKQLGIAEMIRSEREKLLVNCYDNKKALGAAARLMKTLGRGEGFILKNRQISSFGMNGSTNLDTYRSSARENWLISDKRDVYPFLFDALLENAKENSLMTYISYDCLLRPEALFFPEKGVAVTMLGTPEDADKTVNSERFILHDELSENRKRLRFLRSLEDEIYLSAGRTFETIKEIHFTLENIYSEAMDFASLTEMTEGFISGTLKL